MVKMRGPDGKTYEVPEGHGLAVREDGTVAVTEIVERAAPTEDYSDEAMKKLVDHVDLLTEREADFGNKIDSLKDVIATAQRTNRRHDPFLDPTMDSWEAQDWDELLEQNPTNDLVREFHARSDAFYTEFETLKAIRRSQKEAAPAPQECKSYRALERVMRTAGDTWQPGTATEGGNWAPTGVSRTFINVHRITTNLVSAFPSIEIPRGVQALHIPTLPSAVAVEVVGAASGATPHPPQGSTDIVNPLTAVLTLTPKKHATKPVAVAVEEIEDAVVAVTNVLSMELMITLGKARESALINGQTSGDTDLDVGNGPTAGNGYAAADVNAGLRVYGIVTNALTSDGSGVCDLNVFETALRKMGNFGIPDAQNNLVGWLSAKCWFDLVFDIRGRLVNTGNALVGVPVGTLAQVYGVNIFASDQIPNMLATGKVGASSNNFTMGGITNVSRWRTGSARTAEVKMLDATLSDAIMMRGYARHAVGHAPPETDDHTSCIVNVAV